MRTPAREGHPILERLHAPVLVAALALLATGSAGCSLPRSTISVRRLADGGVDLVDSAVSELDAELPAEDAPRPLPDADLPDVPGGCRTVGDCPPGSAEPWGECTPDGAGGECGTTGLQRRANTTFTCEAGMCQPRTAMEEQPCPISSDGRPCGPAMSCSACVGPDLVTCGATEPRGTQLCSSSVCAGGVCASSDSTVPCDPGGRSYCEAAPAWGACTYDLTRWECRRGRRRMSCGFGGCTRAEWESEPCSPC